MVIENLVLVVQNDVPTRDLGVTSPSVNFFRAIGGIVDASARGAGLATRVTDRMIEKQAELTAAIATPSENRARTLPLHRLRAPILPSARCRNPSG